MDRKGNQLLLSAVRRLVPIRYRQTLGLWIMAQAARTKWLLYPWMLVLCGAIPKGLKLLPDGTCRIQHSGISIICPRDGVFTAWEVLQDMVYEKVRRPMPGDVVVDVGAYVGMFTVKAAMQVGIGGTVIAIEPSTSNLEYLRYNTESIPNITVIPLAAGAVAGKGNLSTLNASPCHTLTPGHGDATEEVSIDTVDGILAGLGITEVHFMKIDTEGQELEVLKGAINTIRNNEMKLAIGAYHNLPDGEHELPRIEKLLADAGYEVTVIGGYVYAEKIEK